MRLNRNRDVEALKRAITGGPQEWDYNYWTPQAIRRMIEEYEGYDPRFLDRLKAKDWQDAEAAATQERDREARNAYNKARRERRKGDKDE